MATWRNSTKKKGFNLVSSIAVSSFKEDISNLRKFYLSFKEMCEIGSESSVLQKKSVILEQKTQEQNAQARVRARGQK